MDQYYSKSMSANSRGLLSLLQQEMIVMEFQGPEQVGMNWTQARTAPPSPGSLSEMPTPDFVHINLYFNNLSCD